MMAGASKRGTAFQQMAVVAPLSTDPGIRNALANSRYSMAEEPALAGDRG
jgi:hypothetical protein